MVKPSTEKIDPRDVLRAEIAALPAKQGKKGHHVQVEILPGAYGHVIAAAKARRMSVQAYLRRAAFAFAAHDLGIPLAGIIEADPRVSRETGLPILDPEGTKFGAWEIVGLVGEEQGDVRP